MGFLPLLITLVSLHTNAANQDNISIHKSILPSYLHLTGRIGGKYAITMDLSMSQRYDRYWCRGNYYYNAYKLPIDIDGQFVTSDSIMLDAFIDGEHEERFVGHYQEGIISGIWSTWGQTDNKPKKSLPFELKIDTSCIVPLSCYTFSDEACIFKKGKDCSAGAGYNYSLFLPRENEYSDLNRALCRSYAGCDSLSKLRKKFKNESLAYFKSYRADMAVMFTNEQGKPMSYAEKEKFLGNGSLGCNRQNAYWTTVEYNSSQLFSIRFSNDDYTGGNGHCCLVDKYYSYTKDGHRIFLSNLFDRRDSMVLKQLLYRHLQELDLAKWVSDDVNKIAVPENYYFTPKGVNFVFNGIGMYWAINFVFIPFSELGDKIKKQSWME